MFRAASSFASGRYAAALLQLGSLNVVETWLEKSDLAKRWSGLIRFAGLVGALAEAKTEDDARQILEAAAAPVGSYREYRQGGWAAFIAGYAGVHGGFEMARDVTDGVTFAPILPVGVEFGRPILDDSSFNILVSILDVGALAATRLSEEGTENMGSDGDLRTSPEKGLASVLAPGLFFSVGIDDSPFLVGLGAQYLPANRSVFDCEAGVMCDDTRTKPVFRAFLFLGLDLPVFPLYR